MKTCSKCNKSLQESEFAAKNKLTGKLNSVCKGCQKIYKDNHYLLNRDKYLLKEKNNKIKNKTVNKAYIDDYKVSHGCSRCGITGPAVIFDLHHRNPKGKDFSVSQRIKTAKLSAIKREVSKCDVVCANCHRLIHSVPETGIEPAIKP